MLMTVVPPVELPPVALELLLLLLWPSEVLQASLSLSLSSIEEP